MDILIIKILVVLAMLAVIFQDFKYRAVHWALFPLLFILFFLQVTTESGWLPWLENFGFNTLFIVLNLGLLKAYFSMRAGKWVSIIDRQIGWGDVLLMVVFASALSPLLFIFFFVSGLITTLLVYGFRITITQNGGELIPLAGCLAIFFLLCSGAFLAFPEFGNNIVNEQQFIGLIHQLL